LRRGRVTIFVGKKECVTYSECVFLDLGIQHAICMRLVILSSVACPALHYLISSTILETVTDHKMLVLIFLQHCLKPFSS